MNNFLDFINQDIETKKTLIETMPTNNKSNKKKYNEKIDTISKKYEDYKTNVRNYIVTKSRSFKIKNSETNINKLENKVNTLERIKFALNPSNTYFEKMGFDNLLYEIDNYNDFDFDFLNKTINKFIEKFALANIKLNSNDFNYTCYVHEYMSAFLLSNANIKNNYEDLSQTFEQIYWKNPELVEHIKLNFRKIIRRNSKKLVAYINVYQKKVMQENGIKNYKDCLKKLKTAYIELNNSEKESISDIIDLATTRAIDINQYLDDSKVRQTTYSSLIIDQEKIKEKNMHDQFYENLEKLKRNAEEYSQYAEFIPLIESFKKQYEKDILKKDKDSEKELKAILKKINNIESKLDKINQKILFKTKKLFISTPNNPNQLKIDSINKAKELQKLYEEYNQMYFKKQVQNVLNPAMTIEELLHLYYSFDYFKKQEIKKVFNTTNYNELIKYSDNFDLFAMNPTNIITNNVPVFEESNISKVIVNKYRLDNININEDNLEIGELENLLNKIQLLLRINEVEHSSTSLEKIWFMTQVQKIIDNTR